MARRKRMARAERMVASDSESTGNGSFNRPKAIGFRSQEVFGFDDEGNW